MDSARENRDGFCERNPEWLEEREQGPCSGFLSLSSKPGLYFKQRSHKNLTRRSAARVKSGTYAGRLQVRKNNRWDLGSARGMGRRGQI
jgi:hypothetical protein